MRYYAVALAVVLAVVRVAPAQAAEASGEPGKSKCKTVIVKTGDDENLVTLCEGDDGNLITINEDGKKRIIKLKDGKLLDFDDKLDSDTHIKLLDAKIAYIKATGQLKTDLAVKRAEAEKLKLAKKSDADVAAKKKELEALKVRLGDARRDYKQTVEKLVPEDMVEFYMLGSGDECDLLQLGLDLGTGIPKGIKKYIKVQVDDDKEESD